MISSLFMRSPWRSVIGESKFWWTLHSSRIARAPIRRRPLPVPRPKTRGGTCSKLGLAYFADRLVKSASTPRARLAIYSNCKSGVSSRLRSEKQKISDSKTRTSFATGAHLFGELSACANRFAPQHASESPRMRSCRRRPAESAARPTRACAAPAGARARTRAPDRPTSPEQSPTYS